MHPYFVSAQKSTATRTKLEWCLFWARQHRKMEKIHQRRLRRPPQPITLPTQLQQQFNLLQQNTNSWNGATYYYFVGADGLRATVHVPHPGFINIHHGARTFFCTAWPSNFHLN